MRPDEQMTDPPFHTVADGMAQGIGQPAADDIFTDNVRWGDLDDWNRTALRIHEEHRRRPQDAPDPVHVA